MHNIYRQKVDYFFASLASSMNFLYVNSLDDHKVIYVILSRLFNMQTNQELSSAMSLDKNWSNH